MHPGSGPTQATVAFCRVGGERLWRDCRAIVERLGAHVPWRRTPHACVNWREKYGSSPVAGPPADMQNRTPPPPLPRCPRAPRETAPRRRARRGSVRLRMAGGAHGIGGRCSGRGGVAARGPT
eukprot:312759-Chlamydomonas_euryale.AAC.2